MSDKTIIHIIDSLGRGGAEVLLSNTIPLLEGCKQVLVTLKPPHDQLEQIRPFLAEDYCLEVHSKKQWPRGIRAIRKIIRQHQPALVHAHLQVSALLAKTACPRNVPLFYSIHTEYSKDAFAVNRLARPIERLTARPYHHLIGVSKLALDDYIRHVPHSGSTDVLYNMVGSEFFSARPPAVYSIGDPLRCIAVGLNKPVKNYAYIIDTFTLLRDLPISIDIFGGGPELEQNKARVRELQLENVHFRGKSDDIAGMMQQAHIYIMASTHEGFGIAPLEAMAVGVPALVSDIPVFREVMADAVQYIDISKPAALADMLKGIYGGSLDLAAQRQKGKSRAAYIASPAKYIAALKAIYNKYTGA